MPKMPKKKSFTFFPESYLAGTNHLSDEEAGIFWRMCSRIWSFQADQYSFIDDDDNWMFLTGLDRGTKLTALKKKFTVKNRELFSRKRKKNVFLMVQNGLFKSKRKVTEVSRQNSQNAKSRYIKEAYAKMEEDRSQQSRTDSGLPINLTYLKKKKNVAVIDIKSKADKKSIEKNKNINYAQMDKIAPLLAKYLTIDQVENIFDLIPDITVQYVMDKINITREKKPKSITAFFYAALVNDYKPPKRFVIDKQNSFLNIAKNRPLVREEYNLLSADEKKLFIQNEHVIPGGFMYKYIKKPKGTLTVSNRFVFDTMSIGDDIIKNDYAKLKKSNVLFASCFERVSYSPKLINIWELKK